MRLVSLCPSLTELVFDLGLGSQLVGRTKFCVHPADRVGQVESLGGTKNPKVERIVELAPDLVLLNEEENRSEDAEALRGAGISCHVSFPRTVDDTAGMIRDIARAVERDEEGERIALEVETRSRRVREAWLTSAPVRYAYMIWRRPWMTLNDDTFISAMLSLPGGENVFAGAPDRYPETDGAALGRVHPDLVLLSSEPFPFAEVHARELSEESTIPLERFRFVNGELLSWHGSRTPAGIDYAERVLRTGPG